ncbi:MAG TPA: SGNH/GDSL hydrolase family protein [Marmoricola sp.]
MESSQTVSQPPYRRYVALGDSFTEGVGDPDPARPNGLRGWADRVAEQLAAQADDFGYANLAIRGRKIRQVIAEQIDPAIELAPDLITIYAGANDILRPKVDIDTLAGEYDDAVGRLASTGARIGIFTAFDPGSEGLFSALRGRFALYNEWVREIAEKHGATVLDSWRMRPHTPEVMWSEDRLHLGPLGHEYVAIKVLETLGVPHTIVESERRPAPALPRAEARRQQLAWARTHAAPWVQRRLTGRSSGDDVTAKRPAYEPI